MSDLLNQASLVMVPSGYKEDTVYSVVPSDGAGDLSFTRASNGTRINSAGLVEVCPWNLVRQSNTFSNSTWTKGSSITVTSGQTGYDGSSNAWLLSKGAIQYPAIGQSLVNSGYTTLSIYAKANTNTNICLFQSSSPSNFFQDFNLTNGTLGTNASGVVSASITSVGNGWYFCVVTFNGNTTTFDIFPDIIDGTNAGSVYIQNAQLNIGSTAKPYFPTTDRLNVPRLTYQNGGGGCPSLLLEKQSTNIAYPSQAFSGFTKSSDVSLTDNNAISPDGTQNATYYFCNTTTTNGYLLPSWTGTSGVQYAVSFYAKAKELNLIYIKNINDTGGQSVVNLSDGTYTLVSGIDSISVIAVGNGWYRITAISTSSTTQITFIPVIKGSANQGVYIWGLQIEQSSYPTSYIPTTSSSATRVADACSKTGISSLIGQTEGVIFVDFELKAYDSQAKWIAFLGGGSYYIGLYTDGSSHFVAEVYDNAFSFLNQTFTFSVGTRYKLALAYKTNDFAFYVNGTQIATDNSGTVPATSQFRFEYNSTANNLTSRTYNQAILFPTRLTNAELASLTTI